MIKLQADCTERILLQKVNARRVYIGDANVSWVAERCWFTELIALISLVARHFPSYLPGTIITPSGEMGLKATPAESLSK